MSLEEELERLIDRDGLLNVLSAIASVCHAKAAHIRENWQDEPTAQWWQDAANDIGRIDLLND